MFFECVCGIDNGFDELVRLLNPMAATAPTDNNNDQSTPHRTLLSLNLEGNDIEGEVIVGSILTTPYDCPLLSLNLANNPLSSTGQEAVAEIIYSNKTLLDLNINACGYELRGLNTLTATMRENHTLETLALDRPILTKFREGEVMEQLAKILETNRTLRTLSLRYHDATDHDMKLISNTLYSNPTLMYINLESNKIGVSGAEALASNMLFKGQHSLQFLALSYNFVSDHGAIALAQVSTHIYTQPQIIISLTKLSHHKMRSCDVKTRIFGVSKSYFALFNAKNGLFL